MHPDINNFNAQALLDLNRKCWGYFEDPLVEYERQKCPFRDANMPAQADKFFIYNNKNFALCRTYPTKLLFPSKASAYLIEATGKYRSSNRLEGFTYYDHKSGTSIWRCSQPKPGFFGTRSAEDEELLRHIGNMCESGRVVIYDARGQLAAMGNKLKGGGYENMDNYSNCTLKFADIENIHAVRDYAEKYTMIGYNTSFNQTNNTNQWS